MGAFFNDPEYTARIDRDVLANPSPGPVLGAWHQAGLGVMRGGAMAADAVRMAAAVPVVAFGDDETQDAYFEATDEVIKSAVDRWTPDPASTTLAGRVMGGLAEAALPLMAAGGNPALLMASAQTRTSRSLVDQGVDASTARDVGMVDALTIGAGFMIPAVGRTLASKLAFGAVSNPLLNAAGIAVQAGALNEADAPQAAAQYDPWDLESRAVDAALGAAFGGMAHATGAPGGAPPMGRGFDDAGRVFRESVDEILTYRGAQRYESRALGAPTIAARNAHNAAMRAAMEAMIRDEPVNVGRADMPPPPDVPVLDGAAIGREIALDVFAPKPVPVVAAVPPAAVAATGGGDVAARIAIPKSAPKVVKEARTRAEAAAARHATESRIDTTRDDLLAAIAKEGGISREAATAAGIDPADFNRRGWRIAKVFTTKGLSLEAMAERLAARGYPVTDAQGYGENPMLDALDRSLRGETVKAPDGMEADIAAAAAERDAMQAHEAPLLADHEYAGLDSPNQQRLLDAAVRAQDAGVPPEDIQAITELGGANGYDTAEIIRILDEEASQRGRAAGGAGAGGEPGQGAPAGAGRGVEVLARDGGDLPSRLRITDGGKATTIDVLARDGEGRIAQFATDEAATPKGAAAGEDIDLDLLPEARDLAMAEPDAPIMMVDDLTETTAAQALADADAAIVEAETTYQRAAHAAAGCLLG